MQPYQKEYIANLNKVAELTACRKPGNQSFESYLDSLASDRQMTEQIVKRNMDLLRGNLFPLLDHIHEADKEQVLELQEFAEQLRTACNELDLSLFCQLHKALLSRARLAKDRNAMIEELYWLGIGYHNLCNRLVGVEHPYADKYTSQMRMYFTEAAAYLKYYDEIDNTETRGYILRSRANMALGQFKSASEKIHMVKQTLRILQDKEYQEKAPELPWDKFIYMTHQQMAASISYSKENAMTPQDVADVMESVYIVYQKRMMETASRNERPPIRSRYSYYVIEYYCGLLSLDGLLTKLEELMDAADTSDFSAENMYGIISLPAFYCQFLNNYPEHLSKRKEYIESLYERTMDYVQSFPKASENETFFLYLRQLSHTFMETEKSISYKEFLGKLLLQFAPEIYVHSWVVAKAAVALCEIIMDEFPTFFDDIDIIREITDLGEKKRKLLDYAMECGILHDVGKVNFMYLYSHTGRQWFEDEYEIARLHTLAGEKCLAARESTQHYAAIAQGHHSWYDGSHGYPDTYKRLECQYRQMVDVIGLVDWMDNVTNTARLYKGVEKTFDEAIQTAIELEGKRFSPLLTAMLRDKSVIDILLSAFSQGYTEAHRHMYDENKVPGEDICNERRKAQESQK